MNKLPFNGTICFGGEDFWYHNRGHIDMQLMRRFARLNTTVYINSIIMQKPNVSQGGVFFKKLIRKTSSVSRGLKKSDAGFWAHSPFGLPVHHIPFIRKLNDTVLLYQIRLVARKLAIDNPVVWVACPTACNIALKLKRVKLVYQRTDRYEQFPNVDKKVITEFDKKLKASADLTVFVSKAMYNQENCQCKKALYLDHGVDFDLFASAHNNPDRPEDIADIPKPIIGFYGGFADHTTDTELLEKIADLLPGMSFVFIGQPSKNCDRLRLKKNVWMLGQKPYEQIPHYGKCFDVAIMPWKQNGWIQMCNPVKLKEYLALGKPIVTTPFNELDNYNGLIYKANTADEFARAIKKASTENNNDKVLTRRKKVEKCTWDSKAELVLNNLFEK